MADYDPLTDGDEVEWAKRPDTDGWRAWHAAGVWVEVHGRRPRR